MERDQPRRRHARLAVLGITALAVLTMTAGLISIAVFTDDATVDDNTFNTGTIVLTADPASAAFTVTAMMPGDVEHAEITVANEGSGDLRYAMEAAADGDLADALALEVREGECADWDTADVVVAEAALDGAGFGDKGQGADTGDRDLDAAEDETFCFAVSLPLATDDVYQDTSATATFTFFAEQTANND